MFIQKSTYEAHSKGLKSSWLQVPYIPYHLLRSHKFNKAGNTCIEENHDLTKDTCLKKRNATMNWQLSSFHLEVMLCRSLSHHGIDFAYPNRFWISKPFKTTSQGRLRFHVSHARICFIQNGLSS